MISRAGGDAMTRSYYAQDLIDRGTLCPLKTGIFGAGNAFSLFQNEPKHMFN